MPLYDHFHPPLKDHRQWNSIHSMWATYVAAELNRELPEGYYAEPNVEFSIEIDAGVLSDQTAVATGVISQTWSLPVPTQSIPLPLITDEVEILIYSPITGGMLEGAIELVSPANKDRPAHRDAFVSKCAGFVQRGVGLIMIDVVTSRLANLHNELLERLRPPEWIAMDSAVYACSYHPIERDGSPTLDYWSTALDIGADLPTMPLCLKGGLIMPLELQRTYDRVFADLRIGPEIIGSKPS